MKKCDANTYSKASALLVDGTKLYKHTVHEIKLNKIVNYLRTRCVIFAVLIIRMIPECGIY